MKLQKLRTQINKNPKMYVAILFVGIFVLVGVFFIFASFAQTTATNVEPESGTLAGTATIAADSTASGGKAIKFGTGSTSTLVWSDEFNGTALDTSKWSITTGGENHSQAKYTTNNVSVANGVLDIRTRRHCVVATTDALTDANASVVPCASGKITVYSSGYVKTGQVLNTGRVEVRAKLPAVQLGLWPAIWLRNPTPWCDTGYTDYGELDVMEWYADYPNHDTATSHITCNNNATVHMAHNYDLSTSLGGTWHVWGMKWGPTGVKYYFDGINLSSASGDADKLTDTYADFSGVTSTTFNSILNTLWQVRLNTQVTKVGDQWHLPPDNTKDYPVADYQIDYVRAYSN